MIAALAVSYSTASQFEDRSGCSRLFFFFQAEDGIRDSSVTGVSDVCSSDLPARVAPSIPPALLEKPAAVSRPEAVVGGALKGERDADHEIASGNGANAVDRLKERQAPQQQQLTYQQLQTARLSAVGNSKTAPVDSVATAKGTAGQANSSPAVNAPAQIPSLAIESLGSNKNEVTSGASLKDRKTKSTVL